MITAFPWGRAYLPPSDRLGQKVARLLLEPSQTRDRLTHNMYLQKQEDDPVGRLELAMLAAATGEAVEAKVRNAQRAGVVSGLTDEARVAAALEKGVLTTEEAAQWRRFTTLRRACIMVDDFPHDVGLRAAESEVAGEPRLGSVISQKTAA